MRFRFSACVVLFLLATSLPATAQTAEEAKAFVDSAETVLDRLGERAARAAWVQATYITPDTKKMSARTSEKLTAAASKFAAEAARFNDTEGVPYAVRRKLDFLRSGLTMPAPPDSQKTARLTERSVDLESAYAQGEWCPGEASSDRGPFAEDAGCMPLGELTDVMARSRDEDSLRAVWSGWRTVSPPMQDDYTQFVELMNEGARSLGFSDVGAMWRSNYDMPPAEFADTMDRLWQQVRPLYVELHTYVRHRLAEQYGEDVVAPGEPIPAHLLGNMWAQSWTNIFPLVAPEDADPGYDLTERIREEDLSPEEMVEYGEGFFTSLGLDPLPETFWARSLFEKPADRQVVCHASAWDVDDQDDVRIKMCIEPTAEDFQTIHHELGHNYYQRAYKEQPPLFRGSANDGFHEALGDAVALSVTPQYLQQVGLIDEVPPPAKDIGLLLRSALDKVAFLPFGLMVDKWRWQVFSGEVAPAEYNEAWWDLREQYQGIAPPEERPEKAFDPGAKYHIPANTPYSRYFLARILQFQFHRSLCEEASPDGQLDGPLHRCSVYGSERAGDRLYEMMAMGKERPWPEALEALTGEREMDASAMIDYYAPLMDWLREQNDRLGAESGW
jgi:peptidyl-dipeptidase A